MHKFSFLLLTVWLLCLACQQSSKVSETASQTPPSKEITPIDRFEKAIKVYEAADRTSPPPKGGIVFTGSSSVRMWKTLAEDMAPLTVLNRGFGGSTFPELLHYADRIIFPYEPSCIVIYEGDNDIVADSMSPQDVLNNLTTYHQLVKDKLPGVKTWFIAVKPSIARRHLYDKLVETNALVQDYIASVPELEYLDVATAMLNTDGSIRSDIFIQDSLHMNATGYEIWTEVVRETLMESCGQ